MSGVEGVLGIALAIPGIIDLCIRYGKTLEEKIGLFMNSEEHIRLKGFVIQLVNGGLNDMLSYFKEESRILTLSFATDLRDLTRQLQNVLLKAIEAFPQDAFAEDKGKMSKLKYALYDAKRIDEASEELKVWLERLGQSRRFISGPLLLDSTSGTKYRQLPESSIWILESPSCGSDSLLEYRSYQGSSQDEIHTTRLAVRKIAQKLREVESTQGILPCLGFSEDPINDRFALHFSPPPNTDNPQSLRTLLADPRNRDKTIGKQHSITDRVHLAQAIASAVGYVHSFEFVHKNIRPENIIIFEPQLSGVPAKEQSRQRFPFKIGEPYLVGYDGARNEVAETRLLDVTQWQRRLYLSPDRQDMTNVQVKYSMKHDIYRLGVVLLEIALWEDFTDETGSYGKLFKAAKEPLKLLMQLSRRVPLLLGDRYRDAVVACLTELREENDDHQLEDADGIVVGTAFIAQVIGKLEKISV